MIAGIVTFAREAVLRLRIRDASGQLQETRAVVDTGFDGWLALPGNMIAALGLPLRRSTYTTLADGIRIRTNVYQAAIEWDGQSVTTPVDELDGGPLVGMSLMYGYKLILPILDGAKFTLRRLGHP
ncbi:MAG: clan AA aspartic protease [Planctomycetota bacterium]